MTEKQSPIAAAVKNIVDEKGIPLETVIETVEAALAAAYRKDFGQPNQNIKVKFDLETGLSQVFDVKTVVPDALKVEWEEAIAEAKRRQEEGLPPVKKEETTGAEAAEEKLMYHPRLHLTVSEAQVQKPGAVEGEEMITTLTIPSEFGRMAAQTAKQVIVQKLREAERTILFDEFKGREGTVVQGTIQRRLGQNYLVDIGRTTGIILPEDQIFRERYLPGSRFKFYIRSVAMGSKGPEIVLSRTHPTLVRALFAIEIPEISNGSVEIMSVARDPGARAKIAVRSLVSNVDPIGSCVGQRGSRVQTVIAELGGEKIDIIEWDEAPEAYIRNALSPAKVADVTVDQGKKSAIVHVSADQLSLAIGKGGQNVRLASELVGWRLDIRGTDGTPAEVPEASGDVPARDNTVIAEDVTPAAPSEPTS